MKPVVSMRWAATAALTAIVALAAATSASAASNAPVWGPPVAYGSPSSTLATLFTSISCVSDGNCVAVGEAENSSDTEALPVVAAESGGTWGPSTIVTQLPPEASTSSTANSTFDSVSCTSATSCVAVGRYEDTSEGTVAMVVSIAVSGSNATPGAASEVTLPSEAASGSVQAAVLNGVSCASASSCIAVGEYEDSSEEVVPMTAVPAGDGDWTATAVTTFPFEAKSDIALTAISCPSSGACEAVGNYDNSEEDLYPWAVEVSNGQAGTGEKVALPANFEPSEESGGVLPGVKTFGLVAVSCPSAGACTAAGSYPITTDLLSAVVVPIANGDPGVATQLSSVSAEETFLEGIWCSDASDCEVAGSSVAAAEAYAGVVGSETEGTWSPLAQLPSSGDAIQLITSMTCSSAGHCVAPGVEVNEIGPGETINTFFAYSVPVLSLTTASLPAATVGQPYSATLQATGGAGVYSWSTSNGSLPAGLSLNAATGVISGTPTTAGQSGFAASVSDPGPPSQSASDTNLSITVAPAASPPSPPPPSATVSVAYVTTHGAKATVVLTCSGAPCAGRLKIVGVEHLKGAKVTAVIAKKHKKTKSSKKAITLASGSYALAAGGKQVVTLTLSGAASKLLAGLHSISGDLDVTPLGATSPAVVTKLKFKSTAKAKKHKKK